MSIRGTYKTAAAVYKSTSATVEACSRSSRKTLEPPVIAAVTEVARVAAAHSGSQQISKRTNINDEARGMSRLPVDV